MFAYKLILICPTLHSWTDSKRCTKRVKKRGKTAQIARPLENVFTFWEPRGMTEKFFKTHCIEEENLQYFEFFLLVFREMM